MSDPDDIPEADRQDPAPHPRFSPRLIGQDTAEAEFLTAWQSGHRHHAWLLTGPKGIGKATLAWRIAKYLRSGAGDDQGAGLFGDTVPATSLDTDPNAPGVRMAQALADPGLALVRRPWDQKARRLKADIPVDEVRRLGRFFAMSAADGGTRIAIVDAADELNRNAANALLKMLEEPPANTVLLLISHRPSRLLPTIRSRCRVLRCAPLNETDLATVLTACGQDPGDHSVELAELAQGSAGTAIALLGDGGLEIYARLLDLLGGAPNLDRNALGALADSCAGPANAQRCDLTINLTGLLLTRLARSGAAGPPEHEAGRSEHQIFARLCPDPRRAITWATAATELPARASRQRGVNLDPSAIILDMWLEIDRVAATAVS